MAYLHLGLFNSKRKKKNLGTNALAYSFFAGQKVCHLRHLVLVLDDVDVDHGDVGLVSVAVFVCRLGAADELQRRAELEELPPEVKVTKH